MHATFFRERLMELPALSAEKPETGEERGLKVRELLVGDPLDVRHRLHDEATDLALAVLLVKSAPVLGQLRERPLERRGARAATRMSDLLDRRAAETALREMVRHRVQRSDRTAGNGARSRRLRSGRSGETA